MSLIEANKLTPENLGEVKKHTLMLTKPEKIIDDAMGGFLRQKNKEMYDNFVKELDLMKSGELPFTENFSGQDLSFKKYFLKIFADMLGNVDYSKNLHLGKPLLNYTSGYRIKYFKPSGEETTEIDKAQSFKFDKNQPSLEFNLWGAKKLLEYYKKKKIPIKEIKFSYNNYNDPPTFGEYVFKKVFDNGQITVSLDKYEEMKNLLENPLENYSKYKSDGKTFYVQYGDKNDRVFESQSVLYKAITL